MKIGLSKGGKNKVYKLHILILMTFVGPCPDGMGTRHLDGDPINNRLANLKYGTQKENQHDGKRHGTDNAGDRHGNSKLTWNDVVKIRELWNDETKILTQEELADRYNISQPHLSDIINGKKWKTP